MPAGKALIIGDHGGRVSPLMRETHHLGVSLEVRAGLENCTETQVPRRILEAVIETTGCLVTTERGRFIPELRQKVQDRQERRLETSLLDGNTRRLKFSSPGVQRRIESYYSGRHMFPGKGIEASRLFYWVF